jgi:diacylglycerol kinase (ATP)
MKKNFSLSERLNSFRYAINGLRILFKEEHNARIHLLAAILAIFFGFYFGISAMEWIALIIVIGLVFILEAVNTALENLADVVSPGKNEKIGVVKDLGAGAVLVSALLAVVVGLIIFLPKVWG